MTDSGESMWLKIQHFFGEQMQHSGVLGATIQLYESKKFTKSCCVGLMECGTMSMLKIALASAATLGVVAGTAANAEPIRAVASTPGVVSVNKIKVARSTAPVARESREVTGTDIGLGLLAGGAAGFALYEATKSGDSPAG